MGAPSEREDLLKAILLEINVSEQWARSVNRLQIQVLENPTGDAECQLAEKEKQLAKKDNELADLQTIVRNAFEESEKNEFRA